MEISEKKAQDIDVNTRMTELYRRSPEVFTALCESLDMDPEAAAQRLLASQPAVTTEGLRD